MDKTDPANSSSGDTDPAAQLHTTRLVLDGRVQGVGFRPFVYRLAQRLGIRGWVQNRVGEVEILAQGTTESINAFADGLIGEAPPLARPRLRLREAQRSPPLETFVIRASSTADAPRIHVPPDYFTCSDCLAELRTPEDRRYRYPFINCTQCGPRYTLIRALPYDRINTSMAGFELCPECRSEYEDAADRRFHAEPVACPRCGPALQFVGKDGRQSDDTDTALGECIRTLRDGGIVAVKGIGGYHLLCDACDAHAIERLRSTKPRPHKPLAVMFPERGDDGLDVIREHVIVDAMRATLLTDPRRPIVTASIRDAGRLAPGIAPGLKELGVFLPYSPLHHLLLGDFGGPLIATSGNLGGEPVLTDNEEARDRLGRIVDAWVHHDRPIVRPADDAVYRVIAGQPRPLRLGRGVAPLELDLPFSLDRPMLAVGGHMKNSIALAWDQRAVISPHIGELDAPRSLVVFEQLIADLQDLYGVRVEQVVCDAHPRYASHRWALESGLPVVQTWHHHAHAAAVAGEYPQHRDWLVFTWDGVGYGPDGTLWGGEALLGRPGQWQRAASFRPFRLPGGDKAGREPWRSAASLCWEAGTAWPALPESGAVLHEAWERNINSPSTTAVGRLFDAAAALADVVREASFEGQGPMYLEAACTDAGAVVELDLRPDADGVWRTDWAPLLPMLLDTGRSTADRAACFHASMAAALCHQARTMREQHGEFAVGLGGGVFQNRILTEQVVERLADDGFDVYLPEQVPVNDGGLCFGQVIEAAALMDE